MSTEGITLTKTGEQGAFGGELLTVNFGPHHPSTHGVLRLIVDLDGEQIRRVKPVIGYLHTGIEKQMEALRWQQGVVVTDRHDYLSPPINNLAYALAVEKLMGVDVPPRANALRVIMSELTRLSSHLVWMGTSGLELGAMSMLMYCFRERDTILDMNEEISGASGCTRRISGRAVCLRTRRLVSSRCSTRSSARCRGTSTSTRTCSP